MISTDRTSSQDKVCHENINENRIAPTMKSIWSITGSKSPGASPILLFIKAPAKSPNKAPRDKIRPKKGEYPKNLLSIKPTAVPMNRPAKKPRKVLFFPKIGFPSKKFFPKSMGRPPPRTTGMAFAQYAGNTNFNASTIDCTISIVRCNQLVN